MSTLLHGFSYSACLAIGQRLLTFTSNQLLLSSVNPETFGLATIQFEFLINSVLFISREGIRGTILRGGETGRLNQVPVVIGTILTALAFSLYAYTATAETRAQPEFIQCLILYAFSVPVELMAEPSRMIMLQSGRFKRRAQVEGAAIICKTLITLAGIYLGFGLISYGAAQLIYAGTLLMRYGIERSSPNHTKPLDVETKTLAIALTAQSVVKQFLTEGDKLIMSRVATLSDQAGYGIAENYGSLFARIVFLPIEENSRVYFSASNPPASQRLLNFLVKCNILFSIFLIALAPPYTETLIAIMAPRFLQTSAPALLKLYCFYLPLMGLNGVFEAFVQSTAETSQLGSVTLAMLVWSVVYAASAWFFVNFLAWSTGMLWANCVNMICRILFAISFTNGTLGQVLPHIGTILTAVMAGWIVRASAGGALIMHVACGVFSTLLCASSLGIFEFASLQQNILELRAHKMKGN